MARSPDDCLAQIALDDWLLFSTLFTGDAFCAATKASRPQSAFIAIDCFGGRVKALMTNPSFTFERF
jgi:hypothetical protein